MSRSADMWDLTRPWMGIAGGGFAYALFHQIGSDGSFHDCGHFSPWAILLVGLLTLLAIGLSGFVSFGVVRANEEAPARRVIATVSSLLALLLAFATVMPMIASLMLPDCYA